MLRLKSNVKLTLRASRHINCIVSYSTPVLSISWLPLPSCPQSYPKSQPWSFLVFFGFEGRVEAGSLELFFFKIFFWRNWRTWTRESVEFIKTVIYKTVFNLSRIKYMILSHYALRTALKKDNCLKEY